MTQRRFYSMRILILTILLCYLQNSLIAQFSYDEVSNTSLSTVLSQLERDHNISFSYKDRFIEDKRISLKEGNYGLNERLDQIFSSLDLDYEILDDVHIVIYKEKQEIKNWISCGTIKDKISSEPIAYASIYTMDQKNGVESDNEGNFHFEFTNSNSKIAVSFLGYQTKYIDAKDLEDCQDIFMDIDEQLLDEIVLKDYLIDGIEQSSEASGIVIKPNSMSILPGSVDNDVLTSLQFLPGISNPLETLDGIYVRGGTPDQNLILWDGIPVYHTSHFFGMISAFNPYIIEDVDIYRSGISSYYGGRVSSVIDISSKAEAPERFSAGLGLNLTHSHLELEIPLWKNSGLFISARNSITEVWNTPTFINYAERVFQGSKVDVDRFNDPNLDFNDNFNFNDGNIRWVYNLKKDKFSFSTLAGLNNLEYSTELPQWNAIAFDNLNLSNGGGSLNWERKWNKTLKSTFELNNGNYDYDYSLELKFVDRLEDEAPVFFKSKNVVEDSGAKFSLQWQPKLSQKFDFGYQYTGNDIDIEIINKNFENIDTSAENFESRVFSVFGEYTLDLPEVLRLNLGLRFQHSPILDNNYFEPRIDLSTPLNEYVSLKVNTGKHFQFISQLVAIGINDLGLGNEIWVSSNNTTIPVIESNQWMGGIILRKDGWTIDVEAYVKELVGITSLASSFVNLPNQPYSQGNSKVRGLDLLVKKNFGNYRSWISYTISETDYEFINISPTPFPASHDQPHIFQWVHMYKQKQWEYALGLHLRSGLPFTDVQGVQLVTDPEGQVFAQLQYDDVNGKRLSSYFRLDASVTYNFKTNSRFHGFVSASLQNISNHKNILGKEFLLGDTGSSGLPEILTVEEIGLKLTPNVSVNLRF